MKPLHFLNFKAVRKGDIVCGVNRDLQTEGRTICHTYLYIYMYSIYIYILLYFVLVHSTLHPMSALLDLDHWNGTHVLGISQR